MNNTAKHLFFLLTIFTSLLLLAPNSLAEQTPSDAWISFDKTQNTQKQAVQNQPSNIPVTLLEGPPKKVPKKETKCHLDRCRKNYIAPISRVLTLYGAMYGGLVILWPDAFSPARSSTGQLKKSWTQMPEFQYGNVLTSDGDPWFINGILHPLFGSEVYISARGFGHSPVVSFSFGILSSFAWEYLIEGWFKQPSAIDLFLTSFAGSIIGEGRYQLYLLAQKRIQKRGPKLLVMSILDPLGMLQRVILQCPLN